MISGVGLVQHHPQLANGADCLPTPVIISEDKGPFSYTIQLLNLRHTCRVKVTHPITIAKARSTTVYHVFSVDYLIYFIKSL